MNILKKFLKKANNVEKIAINDSYGGFKLCKDLAEYLNLDYKNIKDRHMFDNDRSNPILIKAIEKIKPEHLKVIEIDWEDIPCLFLKDYDGQEEICRSSEMAYPLKDYLFNLGAI